MLPENAMDPATQRRSGRSEFSSQSETDELHDEEVASHENEPMGPLEEATHLRMGYHVGGIPPTHSNDGPTQRLVSIEKENALNVRNDDETQKIDNAVRSVHPNGISYADWPSRWRLGFGLGCYL